MFKRLLLPIDLTDRHAKVIATAADIAAQSGGSVTLLHIVELIPGLAREEDRAFYDRLEKKARSHMDNLGKGLTGRKVAWQAEVRYGLRVLETVQFAGEANCDLIVLTAPTFDPAHPAHGWGSLSYKISMLSPAPVLLVKS